MNKAIRIFKDWMLPIAIVLGISLYLFYHFTPVYNVKHFFRGVYFVLLP